MFFRGSEQSQGAGLGLYIANEVVIRLNGTLQIESEVDKGTTVKVIVANKGSMAKT